MPHRASTALALVAVILAVVACSSPVAPAATVSPSQAAASVSPSQAPSASEAPTASAAAAVTPAAVFTPALAKIMTLPGAHFAINVSGTFDGGGLGSLVDLSGVKVSGTIDPIHRAASLKLDMSVMGARLTEDYIIIGDVEYSRSNLGGNQWTRQAANGAMGLAAKLAGDVAGQKTIEDAAAAGRVVFTVGPDATIDGVTAYDLLAVVKMPSMDSAEPFLQSLGGSKVGGKPVAWPASDATFDAPVHFYFAKDDFRPLGFLTHLKFATNDLTLTGTVTDAGTPVTIKAPPAKDVINAVNPLDPQGH